MNCTGNKDILIADFGNIPQGMSGAFKSDLHTRTDVAAESTDHRYTDKGETDVSGDTRLYDE